ncbi:MAG: hypothetical protein KDB24_04475, partial [Microthrixaceae bacterium]|nr:hypothetical protein [Microthrixaceae bacterium]
AWVRFSHRLKEWPSSVTDEALLQVRAQLTEGVDPSTLWEESLADGLGRLSDELGVDLADGDPATPPLAARDEPGASPDEPI